MATIPHLAFPLRIDSSTGHLAENEQDTIHDVADCVEAVLLTRVGQRLLHAAFGSSALLFQQRPVNLSALAAQVGQWEPRVRLLAEEDPQTLDDLLARVRVNVSTEE